LTVTRLAPEKWYEERK